MKNLEFTKRRLAIYVSAILSAGQLAPANANELNDEANSADVSDIEVINVKGIRGSLIRSSELKRSNSGVVDAISAEELGKFPDTNLAESLQRITGVSISRNNGEGSRITVRGWGPEFNLMTLNGRQMPGTGNTRSYDLENLSSEGVNTLELYKTSRANMPTGGLGATVNIVTNKPLDRPGQRFSVSAKAIHDSSNVTGEEVTPELAAIYSNTFFDDRFGFAFSASHQRRDFQKQQAHIQGWQANVDLPDNLDPEMVVDPRPLDDDDKRIGNHFFPRDMNYGIEDVQRERANGQVTLQFAPSDDLVATLDYTATKSVTGLNSIGWGMWNDYGGNINGYELDADGTVVYADISGNDGSFSASRATTEVEAESIGLNLKWQLSDRLGVSLDYHDSSNKIDNGADKGLGSHGTLVLGSDQLNTKLYDYRDGEIPSAEIIWKNGTSTLKPSEIDSHFSQFVHSPGESKVEQLQLDAQLDFDGDVGLVTIDFGAAMTKQEVGGSNAWSGLIGGFLFNPSYTAMLPDSMFTLNNTGGFLDQFAGGGSELSPNYYYTFDFDELVARSEAFLTNAELGGSDYFATTAYHDMGTYTEGSVQEDTASVYVASEWEFEVGDYFVQINAGVRYEETQVTSNVLQPVPTAVWWKGGSEWHTQYLDGDSNFLSMEGEHDVLLPMLDIKVDLTDDIVGRVSWGKTISRAPLGMLAGGRQLSGSPKIGSRQAQEGNTNLQPFESTNFDVSFEYYYAEGSHAAIGYYRKDVENFIGTKIGADTIEGFHDIYESDRWDQAVADLEANGEQATNDAIFAQMVANGAVVNEQGYLEPTSSDPLISWDISRPFNNDETKTVDGIEAAIQHLFGDSGFGIGLNATLVQGDVEFDVDSLSQQSPLVGLSDSANLQLFYEKEGLSVKVTYAWRDSYLLGVGQSQGSSDAPPQFAKQFGQWDMSVNYDVSDNLTVFFEGINLNNETEQSYGRYERQFLSARQYGPRYILGARYSFE